MSGAAQQATWRNMTNWPSGRLLEFAEAHPHDAELLEFIHGELGRRDVEVAATAARRVAQLLSRAQGRANGGSEVPVGGEASEESQLLIATLRARLEAAERRVREAEARASAAERALASEPLPSRGGALMRRVHLAETAPMWLVDAARRAFRLRFHPDRFTDPAMRQRAEDTFKEAEEIFRQIGAAGGQ